MGLFGKSDAQVAYDEVKHEYRFLRKTITEDYDDVPAALNEVAVRSAQKFQYLIVRDVEQEALNEYGASGWDLVSATSYDTGFTLNGAGKTTVHIQYAFKRPIIDLPPDLAARVLEVNALKIRKAALADIIRENGETPG